MPYKDLSKEEQEKDTLVVREAGNERLQQAVTQVNVELRLARSRSGATGQRAKEAVGEHDELIAHLRARDGDGARASMKRHLHASLQNTMFLLADAGGETP